MDHVHARVNGAVGHERAYVLAIGFNAAFVAVEAYCGWRFDSLALLADAGHNLGDVLGLVLAWAGALAGRLRPDALLLLVVMGSLVWEALGRLAAPAPVHGVAMIAVAGIGIVVNTSTALLFRRGRVHDLNARGAFVHMAADALVSAGVVLAGALTLLFDWAWADPVTSLVIAAVIVAGTWGLFRQSLHLLFDGVPQELELSDVRASLEALPGVAQVHDLHVWAMSTTQVALTAHLVMPQGAPGDAFLQNATRRLHERLGIEHVTLQVVRTPFTPACGPTTATGAPMADDGA